MMNFLPRRRAPRAFTLIELMVVIAIIALLAALVAYLLPGVARKKKVSRVTAEMRALETVINQYKAKTGFYPPDNTNNAGLPPLFYEIKAVEPATPAEAAQLSISGIANAGEIRQDFFPTMKPTATNSLQLSGTTVWFFVVPVQGPGGATINPWHYNSHAPEHNLESYDLWAEIDINGEKVIIGNWKD
jgi:prepilin-type N-terminal cleavage/methylation domain-containing protein